MNEAFDIGSVGAPVCGLAVEAECHNILWLNHFRAARTRQQEEIGIMWMTHADMPERIDDALIRKNAVGGDEFSDDLIEI
jgi:hypothetical protein